MPVSDLNILISTIDSGIFQLDKVLLYPQKNVKYIVSHQYRDKGYKQMPSFLERKDVIVSQIPGSGVTKSRNNAIRIADGEIGLFADDDVTYRKEYFDTVLRTFDENPDLDVALFKIKTGPGEPEYKNYSKEVIQYIKAPSVGTVEVAIRLEKIKEKKIFFDERFGAGQPLLIGSDESIFVHDCIKSGLKVKYFPEYVVEHPYESTVNKISKYDKRRTWVTGGADCRKNGYVAIPKAFFGTLKIIPDLLKNGVNPLRYFFHRISAVLYILRSNRKVG